MTAVEAWGRGWHTLAHAGERLMDSSGAAVSRVPSLPCDDGGRGKE